MGTYYAIKITNGWASLSHYLVNSGSIDPS